MSSSTANLALPLLQQSQAQKHIVVNEALAILDAATQLTLESLTVSSPPADPVDGQAWGLPTGLGGAWSFQKNRIAVFVNGGWIFVDPKAGWHAYVKDEGRRYLHDGTAWQSDAVATSSNGAAIGFEVAEFEQAITTGTSVTTSWKIPAYTTVMGVTARVVNKLNDGTLALWRLGVPGSKSRYGYNLRLLADNWTFGLTGAPITYYEDTPLVITAQNGAFNGGRIRISVHLRHLSVPRL
ncbi:DUF2793 domain-containing protein [Mangrovicoccus sp. HB161399]|uniref:DUF2793 domain-containing protein n=1 Tax=Mangrovicoccus sp. HB161399 TaxID=2720392 RepID=UPI001553DE36|nr:DUF2793 domain-containing protein [Mangrovicoccus sp. HB161399]